MDKLTHYQNIIKTFLTNYSRLLTAPPPLPFNVVLAFDDQQNQYLLRELGWEKNRRIRRTVLHIAIQNDKIWIEEDWTEEGIATYLLEQGVPNQDIVLGFQPPEMRTLTEFATA